MFFPSMLIAASASCLSPLLTPVENIGSTANAVEARTCITPWASMRSVGMVRQSKDRSCGAAAIATLSGLLNIAVLSEDDVLAVLGKSDEISVSELVDAAGSLNVSLKAFSTSFTALKKARLPLIVLLDNKQSTLSHFVVLLEIADEYVVYADPRLGKIVVRMNEFLANWAVRKDKQRPGIAIVPQLPETSASGDSLVQRVRPFLAVSHPPY